MRGSAGGLETGKRNELTLSVVYNFALVVLIHLCVVDSSVPNITIDSSIGASFISDRLQESRTARTRASEDQTHFTGFQKTGIPKMTI